MSASSGMMTSRFS